MHEQQFIEFLQSRIDEAQRDIHAMQATLAVLNRTVGNVPLLKAPARTAVPAKTSKTSKAGKTGKKKTTAAIPEGVSPDTTLEPDYTINDVPLYFTAHERLLFDCLNEAEEGAFVTREKLMEAAGFDAQAKLFSTLRELREKLRTATCQIINQHGLGYRLQQD